MGQPMMLAFLCHQQYALPVSEEEDRDAAIGHEIDRWIVDNLDTGWWGHQRQMLLRTLD